FGQFRAGFATVYGLSSSSAASGSGAISAAGCLSTALICSLGGGATGFFFAVFFGAGLPHTGQWVGRLSRFTADQSGSPQCEQVTTGSGPKSSARRSGRARGVAPPALMEVLRSATGVKSGDCLGSSVTVDAPHRRARQSGPVTHSLILRPHEKAFAPRLPKSS